MNNRMLMEAVGNWLDERNLPYVRANDHFSFVMDAPGRAAFFDSSIDIMDGTLQLHLAFPVCAHEDELPDANFAVDAINGALQAGFVHWIREISCVVWSVGVRVGECGAQEAIGRMVRFGCGVIGRYCDYLAGVLMNGRESASQLPECEAPETDGMELTPLETLLGLMRRRRETADARRAASGESEEDEEEPVFVCRREEEMRGDCAPAYRVYCGGLKVFNRAYRGNGRNRLVWHRWMMERMDKTQVELLSEPDSCMLKLSLPVCVKAEERERVSRLLDSINGRLNYGMMRCSGDTGMVWYQIKILEQGQTVSRRLKLLSGFVRLMGGCSEAVLRAVYDRNIEDDVLAGLCRESVEELNGRCSEEGVTELFP